jgi:hypothetical protein
MSITKKVFVSAFVAAFALVAMKADAAYVHTGTLKLGSKGASVLALQQTLNMTSCKVATSGVGSAGMETTTFGPKTVAAVKCFQAMHPETGSADGIVGSKTGLALGLVVAVPSGNPNTPCPAGYVCTPNSNGGSTSGSLSGGAGDVDVTNTSTGVDSTVKEGQSNVKVLGFKVKATGSDVSLSAAKVTLEVTSGTVANGSDRIEKYIDGVSVYMGDTKVGSSDASDFSRESGTPDIYTKTISLSNAIVREDKTVTFYVAVSTADTIDTDNLDVDWDVTLSTLRFTDATGAILSADVSSPAITDSFGFDAASADDSLAINASTSNPQATSFEVKEDSISDSDLVLAFKLKSGSDSGDMQVNEIPVAITIANGGNNADSADAVIDSVMLKIDGTTYDSDSDTGTVTNGAGTQTYTFSFDDKEVVVPGDSSTDVKVYVKFNKQKSGSVDNYAAGTTIVASVTGSAMDVEASNGDAKTVSGSTTSKTHTLSVNAPTLALVSTPTLASFTQIDGVASGQEDIYKATFTFNVTAGDDDVYIPTNVANAITKSVTGGAGVSSVTLDPEDSSLDDNTTNTYLVTAGSTEKFSYSVYLTGNNAANKVAITAVNYDTTDTASPTKSVTTGLSTFATPTVYLAK